MAKQADHSRQSTPSPQKWKSTPDNLDQSEPFLINPKDVLADPDISLDDKKSILASWLSDIHSVPGAPRWRQLDNGGFVDIDDIFEALCQIDDLQSHHRNGAVEPTEP